MIVENARAQIGVVANRADGSTMLLTPSSMLTIYPNTYRTPVQARRLAPSSRCTPNVLSVGPAVPDSVKTLKDFFAWTKANPDKAYGSPGAGSMPHSSAC